MRCVPRHPGLVLALTCLAGIAYAQDLSGAALVDALRAGGCYIVMRHASSPHTLPDAGSAHPGNANRERQLDRNGLETASAMGEALRDLAVPVGLILSSPAFRTLETVQQLGLGKAETWPELEIDGRDTAWLLARLARAPAAGTNVIVVTHSPNLADAFGDEAAGIEEGDALIVRPAGSRFEVIARVRVEDWPELVKR